MKKVKWGKYEQSRPDQIEAIQKNAPVAYIPWGALEWHSYHAPIGLDGMKAYGLCAALAKETGGVILPPIYVGTDTIKPYKGFKHTIEHNPNTVTTLCGEYLNQLADEGFKVLILVTGHYGEGHVEAIKKAVEKFSKANPGIRIWAFPDSDPLEGSFPANHAARGETSFQLLFHPEMVDLSTLPDREATLDDDGVWGEDPRNASTEEGQEMLKVFLQNAVPRIKKLLEENVS
ncbi:creatininase family protein [candidate division KSB1 bacterium]|nr:creatininase family protein [candidate division KSB1 bacterium]NIT73685.1 creatininase family protein [candidate division KSB1 bacterium]NIX73365.1 creatininase family protein [candidate division KSB1 bacterium]